METIEKVTIPRPAKWFVANEDKCNWDLQIQRNEVWNLETKSLFIHSILVGFPIPPIYCVEIDGNKNNFIDGKQRTRTTTEYLKNEFALSKNTPDVDEYEVAGLKFDELPEELQEAIKLFQYSTYIFSNVTEEQIEEMFFRLNSGVPLSAMEKTRSKLGNELLDYLKKVTESPFFDKINFTKTDIKRFINEAVVLQILSLLMEEDISFSNTDLRKFGISIKDGISEEIDKELWNILNYLNEAFPEPEKALKKIHIPGIINATRKFIDKVEPLQFGTVILTFLKEQAMLLKEHKKDSSVDIGEYNKACSGSTTKRSSIDTRIDELELYVEEFVDRLEEQKEKIEKDLPNVSGL